MHCVTATRNILIPILVSLLLFTGVTTAYVAPQREGSVLASVPAISQRFTPAERSGHAWDNGDRDCVPASVAMVLQALQNEGKLSNATTDYPGVRKAIRAASPGVGDVSSEIVVQVVPTLTNNALKPVLDVRPADQWQNLIMPHLQAGYPVIAVVPDWLLLKGEKEKGYTDHEGHAIVITGLEDGQVSYNDSWFGQGYTMPEDKFGEAWRFWDTGTNRYWIEAIVFLSASSGSVGASSSIGGSDVDSEAIAYKGAIANGIDQLKNGIAWGPVWNSIKARFPGKPNEQIDSDLGTQWREPGAFERYVDSAWKTSLPSYGVVFKYPPDWVQQQVRGSAWVGKSVQAPNGRGTLIVMSEEAKQVAAAPNGSVRAARPNSSASNAGLSGTDIVETFPVGKSTGYLLTLAKPAQSSPNDIIPLAGGGVEDVSVNGVPRPADLILAYCDSLSIADLAQPDNRRGCGPTPPPKDLVTAVLPVFEQMIRTLTATSEPGTRTSPQATITAQADQAQADRDFAERTGQIDKLYPSLNRLPIQNTYYFVYFDTNEKQFVATLYPNSASSTSIDQQVQSFKDEIIGKLKSTIPDYAKYNIRWDVKPRQYASPTATPLPSRPPVAPAANSPAAVGMAFVQALANGDPNSASQLILSQLVDTWRPALPAMSQALSLCSSSQTQVSVGAAHSGAVPVYVKFSPPCSNYGVFEDARALAKWGGGGGGELTKDWRPRPLAICYMDIAAFGDQWKVLPPLFCNVAQ